MSDDMDPPPPPPPTAEGGNGEEPVIGGGFHDDHAAPPPPDDAPPPPASSSSSGGNKKLCERCKVNKAIAKIALPGQPPDAKIKACQSCIDELAQGVVARQEADARFEALRQAEQAERDRQERARQREDRAKQEADQRRLVAQQRIQEQARLAEERVKAEQAAKDAKKSGKKPPAPTAGSSSPGAAPARATSGNKPPAVIDRNARQSVGGVPNAHSAPITPARRATAAPPVNKQEKAVAAAIDDALAANAVAHSDAKPLEHVTKGRPRPSRTSRPTRATVSKIETRTETDESDDAQRAARQRVATMMGPSTSLATADDEPAPPPPQILSRASMREEHPPPPATLSRASVREEQPPPPATLARASSREPDPPAPPAPESDDPPPPESDDPPPPPPGGTDSPLLPRQPSRGPQRRGPAPGVGIARSPVAARPLSSSANAAVRGPSRAPPQDAATSRGPARATPLSASSSAVPVHAVGRGAAPPPRTSFRGPPPGTPTRAAAAPVANEPAPPEPAPPVHVDSDDEDGAPPPPSAPAAPEHDDHDVDVAPPPQPDDSDDDGDANVHTRPPPSDDPPPPTPPAPTAAAIAAAVAGPPVASPSPPVGPASPAVARRSAGSAVQRPTIVSSPPVQHRGTPPQNGSPANSPLVRQASSPDARRLSQQTAPVTLNRGQSMMSSSGHLHPAAATAAAVLAASANDSPSGWLEKKGLKRFFVLRQKTLYWFKDKVDPNGTVPELAKQSQKSLILTNSRKISKTPKKPGVLIASEKEKSYELFAATPEEADRWFALLVHAQALPMGAIGGATATKDVSPPGSPAAPRNPSPAQIQQQQQQPPQPQMVRSPSRGPAQRGAPDGRGSPTIARGPSQAPPSGPGAAKPAPAAAAAGAGGNSMMFDNGVDLRTFPWFEPKLSGDQAAQRLVGKPLGTYCVRLSSSGSNLVISYVQGAQGQVLHVSVKPTPDKEWLMDGCERPFKSIQLLIHAYKETYRLPLSQSEKPAVLPSPRNISVPVPDENGGADDHPTGGGGGGGGASPEYMDGKIDLRAYPWYHGEMSAQDSFDLLQGQPEGAFLVRYSVNNPGGFVISYVSKSDGILMHLLIKREAAGLMPTAGPKHFADMLELLKHYLPAFDVPISKQ